MRAVFLRLSWLAIVVSVAALGALGAALARAVGGRPLRWIGALVIMGLIVAALGMELDLT